MKRNVKLSDLEAMMRGNTVTREMNTNSSCSAYNVSAQGFSFRKACTTSLIDKFGIS